MKALTDKEVEEKVKSFLKYHKIEDYSGSVVLLEGGRVRIFTQHPEKIKEGKRGVRITDPNCMIDADGEFVMRVGKQGWRRVRIERT